MSPTAKSPLVRARSALHCVLTLLLLSTFVDLAYAQYSNGYNKRILYATDNTQVSGPSPLTDFPVLVDITNTDLRSVSNGGSVQNPNGFDIIFTESDGSTQLDHQLESYDPATGRVIAWVRFPTLSNTSDTPFYLYYDNDSISSDQSNNTTWDANYVGVYHFNQNVLDGTSLQNDGINNGSTNTTGQIANGRDLNGTSGFVRVPHDASQNMSSGNQVTVSAWVRKNSVQSGWRAIVQKSDISYNLQFNQGNSNQPVFTIHDGDWNEAIAPNELNTNEWYYLTGTFDGSTVRLFVNGSQSATAAANGISSTTDDIGIGENLDATGRFMDGQIDEVRISNVARSANWIATEYNNQNNPTGFISQQSNIAPSIGNLNGDVLNYPESAGALRLDQSPFATITEDAQTLQNGSLEVSFTSGYQTGDVLSILDVGTGTGEIGVSGSSVTYEGDLIGSYSGGTGGSDLDISLTTSDATIEAVEALISAIQFENTAASTNTTTREVRFVLTDGDGSNSSPADVTINVQTSLDDLSTGIANPVFHFDAKDVNGDLNLANQPANGSNVQTWGDRSDDATGSGTDLPFNNSTNNQQPVFSTTALGGLEGLAFDGNNDGLVRNSDVLLNSGTYSEKSFAVIFRTGADVSSDQVIYEQGAGTRGYLIGIFGGELYAYTWNTAEWSGGNQHKSINLGPVQANTNYIVIASHDATAGSLAQRTWTANVNNGTLQTLNNVDQQEPHGGAPGMGVVNGGSRNPETLGGLSNSSNFEGTISEFASWNQALSSANFTAIYDYLFDKWFVEPPVTPDVIWESDFLADFFGLGDQWDVGRNWSTGQVPEPGDVVLIPTNPDIAGNFPIIDNNQAIEGLQIETGATVTLNGATLTITDDLSGDGSFEGNNGTLEVGGDISLADLSPNNSTLLLNGTTLQELSGSITIDALELQNSSGVEAEGTIVAQTADIPSSNSLTLDPAATLEITDDISGTGTLAADQSSLTFGGNFSTLSSIDVSSSDVLLNGNQNQQISNFNTVDNLEINNAGGATVTSGNNLEVTGTLTLTDGLLTMASGTNLIANTKSLNGGQIRFLQAIEGGTGWRLLAPPAVSTYGDFLDSVVTQGYPGAFYDFNTAPNDTLQPNVLFYDETFPGTDNQRWRAPSDSSNTPDAGLGMFVYVFGDIPADSRYNNTLPDTLSIIGPEHEGNGTTFTFPVTYTTEADSGWNLVGNPFGATIDWDNNSEWSKSNIDGSIYVWDPSTNSYKTWNGVTGSLNNGLIAPFQGFWVKANGSSPVLTVNKDAKTTGGTFKGKRAKGKSTSTPIVELSATDGENSVSTFLMFSEQGTNGKDPLDAYDLVLPPGIQTYMEFFSINRDGQRFAINHLPRDFGKPIEIPLELNNFNQGAAQSGEINITWPEIKNIPQGWSITLVDKRTNNSTELLTQDGYQFTYSAPRNKTASNSESYNSGFAVTKKSKGSNARFILRISPGQDAVGLPSEISLKQNYPNPFNPRTTIPFSLPVESQVRITIYDILGRRVTTLVNETLNAGTHEVQWDASRFASGIYIYRMQVNSQVITRKLTIIK